MILSHGISGCADRTSTEVRDAASPIIWRLYCVAACSMLSAAKSTQVLPALNCWAWRAASSMSSSNASSRHINGSRGFEDVSPANVVLALFDPCTTDHVHRPTQHLGQFRLKPSQAAHPRSIVVVVFEH